MVFLIHTELRCTVNQTSDLNLRRWCIWLVYYRNILRCTTLWTSNNIYPRSKWRRGTTQRIGHISDLQSQAHGSWPNRLHPCVPTPFQISPFCIRHNGSRSDLKRGMVFSLSDHKGVCRAILYSYQAVSKSLWHNHVCIIVFLCAFLMAEKRLSKQPCPSINLYKKKKHTRWQRDEFLLNVPWCTPVIPRDTVISIFRIKTWFALHVLYITKSLIRGN